jgi:integrase
LIILQRTIRKARGKHCARIRYEDDNGKTREVLRSAENRSDAKTKLAQLEVEILEKGTARLEAGKVTFRLLAQYVKDRFYQPATYDSSGAKVSGVRSVVPAHSAINQLVAFFGDKDIRKIDDEALEKYKAKRLKKVKIATVNRELKKARKMFGVAVTKKWIFENPFLTEAGKELIQVAAEKGAAEHVLTDAEEIKLFKALQKPERRHTIPVFIAALETGARWSSLVELMKWKHVNFKTEEVTITTYKDKNMKQWEISVSTQLKAELLKLKLQRKTDNPDERLFATASVNLRKVWEAARKEAGIPQVRFHDLRHTFATRMADAGMEMQELAKILGHTDISMTYRYYHLTKKVNDKMRNILNKRTAVIR